MNRDAAPSKRNGAPLRLAADIGGTFTDIAVFDDKTGRLTFGKALSTPQHLVEGITAAVEKAGSDYRVRRPVPARLDHRDQHDPGAHRRPDRAGHHRGLPRHLRDRPHQPAGRLQPVLPEARAAGRALAALRGERARARRRRDRPAARRGRGRGARPRSWPSAASRRRRSCSSTAMRSADHEARAKEILEQNHPEHVRVRLARALPGISRVRALLDRGGQRLCRADRAPLHRRDRAIISDDAGFDGSFLIVQSTGGLYEAEQAQQPMRPHAGIRSRGRRDRHAGAVPHARHRQRDRLRHGRHHRQGGRDLRRRGADHRAGAARRLRPGAARADRHDGHFRGRHRRRLDRARRGGRRCASARRARAPRRVRPATASAAPSRP